ncbi:hypothetical protein Mycch_6053 (plasmid) [Mycolicibacterium chubuense NBB4]|uniref:Uncharacterized protein n=1 Tax=Mycolicibacterium chubuense (strain NBB4) TaxID=710421 RepID=I4BTP6_MYCCN|nr:hypothetical protein [Mycolicibacterium chubuense]AFM20653.1 hypothetical protein Mycch_6053 [Mycolicibacterium chubuense NBB4]
MADTNAGEEIAGRRRNWRHRENRASSKLVAKRVSEEDHHALTRYADARGVKLAELLAPAVDDLIQQAREFCNAEDAPAVRAS